MSMKFNPDFRVTPNLEDKTVEINYRDNFNRVVQETLDTREKLVRDALIELGWTPPKGETE